MRKEKKRMLKNLLKIQLDYFKIILSNVIIAIRISRIRSKDSNSLFFFLFILEPPFVLKKTTSFSVVQYERERGIR